MIIFATITLVDITAHADKDTFSMTTTDPAQVRGIQTRAQEACSFELSHSCGGAVLRAWHTAFDWILISVNIVCGVLLCFLIFFFSE